MQVARRLDERLRAEGGTVVSIGFFDGVHRGHHELLRRVVERARALDADAIALTFEDHPQCLFTPGSCPFWLTTVDEKIAALEALGLDFALVVPFDWSMANLSAEEFVRDYLCARLGLRELVCGADFALGKGRAGTVEVLRTLGEALGFRVDVVAPVRGEEHVISSTLIRDCIARGEVERAAQLLGRPYTLPGRVVSGQGLGRQIGVPTLNLEVAPRKVLPLIGVYAAQADCGNGLQPAVVNLGMRPTVGGTAFTIEAHLLDSVLDSAPARLALHFVGRLREETKFPSLDALVAQIRKDIECARARLLV